MGILRPEDRRRFASRAPTSSSRLSMATGWRPDSGIEIRRAGLFEFHDRRGPLAGNALELQRSALAFHQAPDQREADSQSLLLVDFAVELREYADLLDLFPRHAAAVILHLERGVAVFE